MDCLGRIVKIVNYTTDKPATKGGTCTIADTRTIHDVCVLVLGVLGKKYHSYSDGLYLLELRARGYCMGMQSAVKYSSRIWHSGG